MLHDGNCVVYMKRWENRLLLQKATNIKKCIAPGPENAALLCLSILIYKLMFTCDRRRRLLGRAKKKKVSWGNQISQQYVRKIKINKNYIKFILIIMHECISVSVHMCVYRPFYA
jgi:hypothetical protein